MSNISKILEGLSSNRIYEGINKEQDKEMIKTASLIGHRWWKYLDSKYFGPVTNSCYRVGSKTSGSSSEKMCGRYVCHAEFNSSGYDNDKGFIVGFNLLKENPKYLVAKIYSFKKDLVKNNDGYTYFELPKSNIKDVGIQKRFRISDSDIDLLDFAEDLANEVNKLASKEPKKS